MAYLPMRFDTRRLADFSTRIQGATRRPKTCWGWLSVLGSNFTKYPPWSRVKGARTVFVKFIWTEPSSGASESRQAGKTKSLSATFWLGLLRASLRHCSQMQTAIARLMGRVDRRQVAGGRGDKKQEAEESSVGDGINIVEVSKILPAQ